MSTDDRELIRDYAAEGSQVAFATLVNRHVDLVYSAAKRQVRSADLAEEVTQSVFIALARHVHTLKPGAPLAAWLYLVTRRAAIDLLRSESRRQVREQTAFEIAAMKTNSPGWNRVEPLLDEAMEALAESDRSAILLRYFENKSLREVGHTLGMSEDAAQKRVSRALEQLRVFFFRRGVTVGAAVLAADLSAGAVQTAPIGLGLALSSAAAITGVAGSVAALETVKTITMTTLQKMLLATTFATVIGAGLYEQRQVSVRDGQLLELQQQLTRSHDENRRLQREQSRLVTDLASIARENDAVRSGTPGNARELPVGEAAVDTELKDVFARVNVLKEKLSGSPEQQIPELRLLKGADWITIATKHKLETEGDMVAAFANLRETAKVNFSEFLTKALWRYAQANAGQVPTDIAQLASYLDAPGDSEMLSRYGIMRTGLMSEIPGSATIIAEIGTLDGRQDSTLYMSGPRTRENQTSVNLHGGPSSDISGPILQAVADYIKARSQQPLTDASQLLPYLKTAIDPARLQEFWAITGLPNNLHSPRN